MAVRGGALQGKVDTAEVNRGQRIAIQVLWPTKENIKRERPLLQDFLILP